MENKSPNVVAINLIIDVLTEVIDLLTQGDHGTALNLIQTVKHQLGMLEGDLEDWLLRQSESISTEAGMEESE